MASGGSALAGTKIAACTVQLRAQDAEPLRSRWARQVGSEHRRPFKQAERRSSLLRPSLSRFAALSEPRVNGRNKSVTSVLAGFSDSTAFEESLRRSPTSSVGTSLRPAAKSRLVRPSLTNWPGSPSTGG